MFLKIRLIKFKVKFTTYKILNKNFKIEKYNSFPNNKTQR